MQSPAHAGADNPALGGYDPVSYFKAFPEKGKRRLVATHAGTAYWFSVESNLEEFSSNPERFIPQYSGLCATNYREGFRRPANPLIYLLVDGKLYMFSSLSALQRWQVEGVSGQE
nr:YHS domain-containing (seleno)protein [Microbulbifer sediminum]